MAKKEEVFDSPTGWVKSHTYDNYQAKAGREIPVVVLRPVAPEAAEATRAGKAVPRVSRPGAARKTAAHSRNTKQRS